MTYDVFISYPSGAQKIAEALLVWLERQHGVRCFAAFRDLPDNTPWKESIPPAIRESRLVVAIFAEGVPAAAAPVYEEVSTAIEIGRPVLPFRLRAVPKDASHPPNWARLNWMDAFPNPQLTFAKITRQINKLLAKQTAPAVAAAPARDEADGMQEAAPGRRGLSAIFGILLALFLAAVVALAAIHLATGGTPFTNRILNLLHVKSSGSEITASRPLDREKDKQRYVAQTAASQPQLPRTQTPAPPQPVPSPRPPTAVTPPPPTQSPLAQPPAAATVTLPAAPVIPPVAPQPSTAATARPAASTLRQPGLIQVADEIAVRAGISGIISEIRPTAGDTVTRGQTLASFDAQNQREKIAEAKTQFENAAENVNKVTLSLAEKKVIVSQNQKRREETGGLSPAQQEWDAALAAAKQLETTLEQAKTLLEERRARYDDIKNNLEKIRITAPANGIVLTRQCELGQIIRDPAFTLFTLAPTPIRLRLQTSLPKSEISRAIPGRDVAFTLAPIEPGIPAPTTVFVGKILKAPPVAADAPATAPCPVEIEVTSPQTPLLASGLSVLIEFPAP